MALYRYVKKIPPPVSPRSSRRFAPLLLVLVGVFFFANAAYPIVSYQLLISPRFSPSFISPTTESAIAQSFGTSSDSETAILGTEIDLLDLTKASNWYPEKTAVFDQGEEVNYHLSIPKLGVEDALVTLGDDLKKSLVQYPGTAEPGRFGNTVVFGHSFLPQFYSPKNYTTIFTMLPTLRPKDKIVVKYNEITYEYLVEQMLEVSPTDISILAQRYDDSYLTLITCVPPGTYLKRLIVRARLTKI